MSEARAVERNVPLLVSGLVSLVLGALMPFVVMDFGSTPGAGFAILAIVMLLLVIWGIVGTVLGIATLVPGIAR